jgi:hypothetical protein
MAENAKLEVKKARLRLYLAAEKAILSGQSYEIEGLKLTRANLKDVQTMVTKLEAAVEKLSGGGGARLKYIVPRDS